MNTKNDKSKYDSNWKDAMVPSWEPKKVGDEIAGIIEASGVVTMNEKEGPRDVPYVDITTDDGECLKVFMGSAGLHSIYQREQPQPGDTIAFRLSGFDEARGKKGNPMKIYQYRYTPA